MDVSSPSARNSFQNTDASLEASLESTRQTSSKPSMRFTQAALSGLAPFTGGASMTVLRRFDCVLASSKAKVLTEHARSKGGRVKGEALNRRLNNAAGQRFHNHSYLDFEKLKGDPDNIEKPSSATSRASRSPCRFRNSSIS